MKSDYQPLSNFADVKGGKRLPKGNNLTTIPNSHPYIRVRDLGTEKVLELTSDYEYVDDETQAGISRYTVNADDIIISIVGTIGLIAKIGKSLDKANLTENCAKIVNIHRLDRDFLYYYLLSEDGQNAIKAATVGAVQAKLPLKNIQTLPIPNVPIDEQKAVAEMLSALDSRISENKKINHHLEQMAQAIFVEQCSEGTTAVLSDVLTVCYGKDHKRLGDGKIPCYGSGGIMRYVDDTLYSSESVLIPRKGSLNNVLYINEPFWTVDTMFYTHMTRPNVAKFVYFTVRSLDLAGMNVGSAVPSMTTAVLNALEIVLPNDDDLASFEEIVNPMFLQMQANKIESARLTTLRDSLLPRLMSGKLSVADLGDAK